MASQSPPPELKEKEKDLETEKLHAPVTTLLQGRQLVLVFFAFVVAFSLVALDQTIISTALPTIASHFQAVKDLSWIASAYFLPQAGFMLFFGKILAISPAKPVFLTSIAIFEIGSLFCAVSPSVNFLIFGRAVAGVGAAGLWVSIMSIVARITTVRQRPLLMGLFGAVFAVSSIVGPLLGGVFADHVSWRYQLAGKIFIRLDQLDAEKRSKIGGVALITVLLFLPSHTAVAEDHTHLGWKKWLQLDWIGAILSFATVTTLLIPLQWGGNEKPWNDPVIIALFVVFAVLVVIFVLWEYRQSTRAILPLHLFTHRSMVGACIEAFCINLCFILASIRGHSATKSGIDILPFMVSGVLATVVAGGAITVLGRPWPFLVLFPLIAAASFGLLFSVSRGTSLGKIAGYQILIGAGLGAAIQNTVVVAQAMFAYDETLVPQATSVVTFMQLIGSAVGLAVAGAVFSSRLNTEIAKSGTQLSKELQEEVLASIKTVFLLPAQEQGPILNAYSNSVSDVFLIGIPMAIFASFAALLISRTRIQSTPIIPS